MSVRLDIHDGIGHMVIDRPESRNALTAEDIYDLVACWRRLAEDEAIAVGVLSGTKEAFCAGADLKSLLPIITGGGMRTEIVEPEAPAFAKFLMDTPVVAAVRGVCVAGGTELLQATDIRVAADDATFGLPESRWGLFPAGGSTVRLPRQIPYCQAMELLLTGDTIDAGEALRIGLVNKVVPSDRVESVAIDIARRIARNGPVAVRAIKRSVLENLGVPLRLAFAVESVHATRVFQSSDAVEGPLAFAEKRQPVFGQPLEPEQVS